MGEKVLDEENLDPVGGVVQYKEENIQEIREEKKLLDEIDNLEMMERRSSLNSSSLIGGKGRRSLIN